MIPDTFRQIHFAEPQPTKQALPVVALLVRLGLSRGFSSVKKIAEEAGLYKHALSLVPGPKVGGKGMNIITLGLVLGVIEERMPLTPEERDELLKVIKEFSRGFKRPPKRKPASNAHPNRLLQR